MSSTTLSNSRLAWQDRWSKPDLEAILGSLKPHHRRAFNHLTQQLEALEGVSKSLIWYGPGWKWTLQFVHAAPRKAAGRKNGREVGTVAGAVGAQVAAMAPVAQGVPAGVGSLPTEAGEALCYLVPDSLMPLVCIPLRSQVIEHLPLKRLSKYIRDGIAVAKCAVAIHWAIWSPAGDSDVGLLMDLVKRKHTIINSAEAPVGTGAARTNGNGSAGGNGHGPAKPLVDSRPSKKSA
jgi:hypothetical protein